MTANKKAKQRRNTIIIILLAMILIVLLWVIRRSPESNQPGIAEPPNETPANMSYPGMGTERLSDGDTLIDGLSFPKEYQLFMVNSALNELKKNNMTASLPNDSVDWEFSHEVIGTEEYWTGKTSDALERQVYIMCQADMEEDIIDVVYLKFDKKVLIDLLPDSAEPGNAGD